MSQVWLEEDFFLLVADGFADGFETKISRLRHQPGQHRDGPGSDDHRPE